MRCYFHCSPVILHSSVYPVSSVQCTMCFRLSLDTFVLNDSPICKASFILFASLNLCCQYFDYHYLIVFSSLTDLDLSTGSWDS
uniref:Elongator complex protein 4 isoform X1 n=1 Tax=Rhizophora mucronata TaxID=61149 RepID=A0A2P2L0R9_RHIMU